MNRAWIPAGALAGVSVAGLIALGPLTSSLVTQPSFPSSVAITSAAPAPKPVAVSYPSAVVGKTSTQASLPGRGGQADTRTPTSGEAGQVGVQLSKPANPTPSPSIAPAPAPSTTSTTAPKKPKRRTSIGGVTGGSNGDAGLAEGGSNSRSSRGGLQRTPNAAP